MVGAAGGGVVAAARGGVVAAVEGGVVAAVGGVVVGAAGGGAATVAVGGVRPACVIFAAHAGKQAIDKNTTATDTLEILMYGIWFPPRCR